MTSRHSLLSLLLLGLFAFTATCATEPLRLITIGDSITRGVRPDVKPEQTFAALVQQALEAQGIPSEVVNAGIGGDTVDALKRLKVEVIVRQPKPHLVTLMYGTNDSYITRGQTKSRNSEQAYETALREMITALQQADIRVLLMPPPRWAPGAPRDGLNQDPNVQLQPYVEICRKLANEMQIPLVDHFAHWTRTADSGVSLKDWTSDFCHPNPRGHQELAAQISPVLLPLAQKVMTETHRKKK